MGHAYTPGLEVNSRMVCRARRLLPISGEVVVEHGVLVAATDVVARASLEGEITPVNVANLLALPPADVPECLLKKEGDRIEVGESIARTKGVFGMFKRELPSKVAGTVETVSSVTGQVIIRGAPQPLEVLAYVTGEVVEVMSGEGCVIETDATFVQGIFGIGGEAFGPLVVACESPAQELTPDAITDDMKDAVVIGGARMGRAAFERGREVGVAAIVVGGFDDQDLRDILGYDLGVAITGSEEVGLTLVVTEGFGSIAMAQRTHEILASRAGDMASVNGTTQIRAGVMRPEVVIPYADRRPPAAAGAPAEAGLLAIGRPVRAIREPHFGRIGRVAELPPEPQVLASGSRTRVLEVEFADGERAVVPRANVELIEGER